MLLYNQAMREAGRASRVKTQVASRRGFGAILIGAAALALQPASGQEALQRVAQQGYSRDFGGQAITTSISLASGGVLSSGGRLSLQIDIDTQVEAGAAEISAAMLNGLVEVALPPGLEPDGKVRLSYYDESKSSYQFMYSRDFPVLERLSGLEGAFASAAGSSPEGIFEGLSQVALALDPSLSPKGPSRPEINGQDSDYAVTGITWLLPGNMLYKPVVDLFDSGGGLQRSVSVRVAVPLKVSGTVSKPVVVYAGGLSAATQQGEADATKLPPTAIPLGPLPPPPPAAEPASGAAASGKAGQKPPPPGGAASDAGVPAQAVAPQVVPALLCSYAWIAWETEIAPSALGGASAVPEASQPLRVKAPEELTAEPTDNERLVDNSVDIAQPDGAQNDAPSPPRLNRDTPKAESEPSPKLEEDGTGPEVAAADTLPIDQAEGVKEVKPGTLGDEPDLYTVPLKPITGAAGSALGGDGSSGSQFGGPSGDSGPITFGERASGGPSTSGGSPALPGMDDMVLIPAGEFLMGTGGSSSAGDADELPQASVNLPDYYIDKYPVLNRQFYEFVVSSGYKAQGKWEKYYSTATANDPVRGVTWEDASAYAKWAHKRLPTEAEWEKAARGTDGRSYPWGEAWSSDLLPREENLYRIMMADGTASPYGVMGMVGVVWQWTASAYTSAYPFDPNAKGEKRVLRGGAFSNGRNIVRCANRYAESPNVPLNTFGFRCAKDAR